MNYYRINYYTNCELVWERTKTLMRQALSRNSTDLPARNSMNLKEGRDILGIISDCLDG